MISRVRYERFETEFGWCAGARGTRGLCAFVLPMPSARAAEAEIRARHPGAVREPEAFVELIDAVTRYFQGWTTEFDGFELDLSAATAFQQKVWTLVGRIPYGQVRTYHWVGMEMGRPEASRAIGAAVGANPVPLLIPCHRVVAADGALCGFSACGGIDLKARMLELERVPLHGEGRRQRVLAM